MTGNVADDEMLRTFNCGVGMFIAVAEQHSAACLRQLEALGETAWLVGDIVERGDGGAIRYL